MHIKALELEQQINEGADPGGLDLRPTLIAVPNSLIDTWYREISKFFSDRLYIRQYYSNEANVKDINHKANTLPSKSTKAAGRVVNVFPPDDVRSARVVILTAYETFAQRIRREGKEKTKIGMYSS